MHNVFFCILRFASQMLKVSIDNGLGKAARGLDADKHPCLKTYRSLLELFHKKIRPEKFFFALRTG